MGKNFEITPASRKAIDKAMARLDAKRVRQRKAKQAAARDKAKRRERERADARRAAAKPEVQNRRPNALRMRYGLPGWQVLVARMDPGVWYAWADILALMPEFGSNSVKGWLHVKAEGAGVIVRAGNPDFRPNIDNPAEQGARYLYSIAASATGKAAEWRLALGLCSETADNEKARQ